MTFSITHLDGSMEQPKDHSVLASLLEELVHADIEHGDVAVLHESGWTLTVTSNGRVIWENVESDLRPRHLNGLAHDEVIRLMDLVARGAHDAVDAQPWSPGYS